MDLLKKAKDDLIADMEEKNIGAVIWDLSTAGFAYIPEINLAGDLADQPVVSRITGLYRHDGMLYAIEEDVAKIDFDEFYNTESEVKPSVVTLTESVAEKDLGNPTQKRGYTVEGTLEEWLSIADCYFQALNEQFQP